MIRAKEMPTEPAAPVYLTELDEKKAHETIEKITKALVYFTSVVSVTGIGALVFTMVNVCIFAVHLGISTWIAWMLDPIVSIALLGSLLTDGIFSSLGMKAGKWDWALRIFAGMATWTMNVWSEIFDPGTLDMGHANPAGILLHSVAPVLVIIAGEALAYKRRQAAGKILQCEITIRDYQAQCAAEEREAREAAQAEAREAAARAERDTERKSREAREEEERKSRERVATAERESRERVAAEARESAARLAQMKIDNEREARESAEALAREAHAAETEKARIAADARLEEERLKLAAGEAREIREAAQAEAREAAARAAQAAREEKEAQAREAQRLREEIAGVWEQAHRENRQYNELKAREAAEREAREPRETDQREPREKVSRGSRETPVPPAREDDSASREAKKIQRAQAEFKIAKLMVMLELDQIEKLPTHAEFAEEWGAGPTWGGDRFRAAAAKLDRESGDADWREAVEMDVMEELTKTTSGS